MRTTRRNRRLQAVASAIALGAMVLVPVAASAATPLDVETTAHRGAAMVAPENTLAGLDYARKTRAASIEVDVQLSADGVPVLFHDVNLTRTTDAAEVFPGRDRYRVGDFTWEELQQLDAGSWFHPDFAGEPIPLLEEAIEYATHGSGINIELKSPELSPGLEQAVADVLAADARWHALNQRGGLVVSSFDLGSLATFHELAPEVPVAGIGGVPADDATLAEYASWMDTWVTNYRILDPADIARIQDAGMAAVVYTVNSPAHMLEMIELGVDGIVTDVPQVLERIRFGRDPLPDANGVVITDIDYNPPGSDIAPEVGEHIVIVNTSDVPVDLTGWTWIDAVANRLDVAPGYVLQPGETLRSYVGPGTDREGHYYNDFGRNVLNNNGDSVALFTADRELVDLYAYYGD